MKHFTAFWSCPSHFVIPDDVYEYLHDEAYGPDTPGRWYIRYNVMYYFDKEMVEHTLQGSPIEDDGGCKIPTSVQDEDGEVRFEDK